MYDFDGDMLIVVVVLTFDHDHSDSDCLSLDSDEYLHCHHYPIKSSSSFYHENAYYQTKICKPQTKQKGDSCDHDLD